MNAEDRLRRHVIMSLICDLRVNKAATSQRYAIDFDQHFADALAALAPLANDGLVTLGEAEIRVEADGRPLPAQHLYALRWLPRRRRRIRRTLFRDALTPSDGPAT